MTVMNATIAEGEDVETIGIPKRLRRVRDHRGTSWWLCGSRSVSQVGGDSQPVEQRVEIVPHEDRDRDVADAYSRIRSPTDDTMHELTGASHRSAVADPRPEPSMRISA